MADPIGKFMASYLPVRPQRENLDSQGMFKLE